MGGKKKKRKGWSKAKRNREQRRLVARSVAQWGEAFDEGLIDAARTKRPRATKLKEVKVMTVPPPARLSLGSMPPGRAERVIVDDLVTREATPRQRAKVMAWASGSLPPLSDVARGVNLSIDTMERIRAL